mgnify:CR=1 FL=1
MKKICLLTIIFILLLTACGRKEGVYFDYSYNNIAEVNIHADNNSYQKDLDDNETKQFVKDVINVIKDKDSDINVIDNGSFTLNNGQINYSNDDSKYIEIVFKDKINVCFYEYYGRGKGKKFEYENVSTLLLDCDKYDMPGLTLISNDMHEVCFGFGNEDNIRHIFDEYLDNLKI